MIIKAERSDKNRVVELLSLSFKDNLSVAYLTGGSGAAGVGRLMGYAFELCFRYGQVWLTQKRDGCALVMYPHLKRFSVWSFGLDLKLLVGVIGVSRFLKVLGREKLVNLQHPSSPFCYLWFIGVNPWVQRRGIGTELLQEVLREAESLELPVYLETSASKCLPWYQKQGFVLFHELDLGYRLFFLKKSPDVGVL